VSLLGLLFGTVRLDGIRICGDGSCVRSLVRCVVRNSLGLAGLVIVYLFVKDFSGSGKGRRDLNVLSGGTRG
jgi:hypothetical protein